MRSANNPTARQGVSNVAGVAQLGRLGLPVEYEPRFLAQEEATAVLCTLFDELTYGAELAARTWGRQPRLARLEWAFGDRGSSHGRRGVDVPVLPWTPTLQALRDRIGARTRKPFPVSVALVTLLRDGRDHVGSSIGPTAGLTSGQEIFSLSLGARRDLLIRPRARAARSVSLSLGHGSLLVLRHPTPLRATAELPPAYDVESPSLSVTFADVFKNGVANSVQSTQAPFA